VHGVAQTHVLVPWAQRLVGGGPRLSTSLLADAAAFGWAFELPAAAGATQGLGDGHAAAAALAAGALAALAALADAARGPGREAAGAAAEVAAAGRARKSANAFFAGPRLDHVAHLGSSGDARAAAAADAAAATRALAAAWERKFAAPSLRAAWARPCLAALSTGVAAAAFALSGGDLFAPVACAAVVLWDRYALRPSLRNHGRATATLPALHATAERATARADGP
jgi:hypothetical protein